MSIAPLFFLLGLTAQQTPVFDWVVKDTLLPLQGEHGEAFQWGGSRHPFGDVDGNGIPDTLGSGIWRPQGGTGVYPTNYVFLETGFGESLGLATKYLVHGGGADWAILGAPTGPRLLLNASFSGLGGQFAFDIATGRVVGEAVAPINLPGGVPDPGTMARPAPSGDTDGDGYEDFFWAQYSSAGGGAHAYFGLADGASLTSRWTNVEVGNAAVTTSWEPQALPDLNGDGVADVLIGVSRTSNPVPEYTWALLSGVDGTDIWRENGYEGIAFFPLMGKDYTGDGFPEACLWQSNALRLISAKDGVEIWNTPWSVVEQALPQGWALNQNGAGGQGFSMGLRAGDPEMVISPFVPLELGTFSSSLNFANFSVVDGSLLGIPSVPPDLSPWDPNILLNGSTFIPNYYSEPYGDFDNDGLMEYSIRARDEANSPAWAVSAGPNSYSQRLVILGQRTLFTEETHDVLTPSPVTFNLICPSGPGKDFVVLLSTQFSERHGMTIGRWKTYLGASSALDMTIRSRALSGTLDAEGQGFTYAMVPPNPNLIGQTLYSRGLILNPAGSADPLWSMTSLGQTLLQ